ncbi:MAG: 5'/3'-nucleotidase SurE [Gammaproteobacteria bacterium]|nr:5'/3'-nucleotidase SurE [Gammaproteobacteria bacterium]NNJ85055.1 5'/3'-nucleotidase SurE [Gammaproteobacteria bacterium]
MNILLSNDDGYLAPGLAHLARGLSSLANVTVIAPDRNQSGVSSALTFSRPLRAVRAENGFVHVDGTPADCVHLAVTGFFQAKWDVVLSGINAGRNLGDDVLYSGTLAAAMEARSLGIPAIAISLNSEDPVHYETAVRAARLLLERLAATHADDNVPGGTLPGETILNVNVPDVEWRDIQGFEVTRLGDRSKPGDMVTVLDPHGRAAHWIGHAGPEWNAGPGTDFFAIRHNKISVTPIQVDRTKHAALKPMANWIDSLDIRD